MIRSETKYIVLCSSETEPTEDIGLEELTNRDLTRCYPSCIHHFVIKRCGKIQHGKIKYTDPSLGLGVRLNHMSVSICIVGGKGEPPIERAQILSVQALLDELLETYPTAQVVDLHQINQKATPVDLAQHFNPKESNGQT